jgi:N-acetylglutamate synthase-like GNAT family acetyltransferase
MPDQPSVTAGRIRRATPSDLPAIGRLMVRAHTAAGVVRPSELELAELMKRGEIIVLATSSGELAAAACLTTSHGRGHLAFLVVDPASDSAIEERIRAVAAALSDSERCEPSFAPSLRHVS